MWYLCFMEYKLWRKYCKKYIRLVRSANNVLDVEFSEKHHIFPQSIFGKNKRIVRLTPRQHFVAHKLLHKIFLFRNGENSQRCHKMEKAFCWMQTRNCVKFNSRRYAYCKNLISKSMLGDKNPFNKSECFSAEHRRKISEALSRNHPFKGKKHTEEARAKIREKRKLQVFTKEQNEKRAKSICKKIMTPNGMFASRKEAAIHYKIDPSYLNCWMKTKPTEFYYIKK
jgi:hypothetical protein